MLILEILKQPFISLYLFVEIIVIINIQKVLIDRGIRGLDKLLVLFAPIILVFSGLIYTVGTFFLLIILPYLVVTLVVLSSHKPDWHKILLLISVPPVTFYFQLLIFCDKCICKHEYAGGIAGLIGALLLYWLKFLPGIRSIFFSVIYGVTLYSVLWNIMWFLNLPMPVSSFPPCHLRNPAVMTCDTFERLQSKNQMIFKTAFESNVIVRFGRIKLADPGSKASDLQKNKEWEKIFDMVHNPARYFSNKAVNIDSITAGYNCDSLIVGQHGSQQAIILKSEADIHSLLFRCTEWDPKTCKIYEINLFEDTHQYRWKIIADFIRIDPQY